MAAINDKEENVNLMSLTIDVDGNPFTVSVDAETFNAVQRNDQEIIANVKTSIKNMFEQPQEAEPTASTSQASTSDPQKMVWTDEHTALLVTLRMEMDVRFNNHKSHKSLWNEIGAKMLEKGCNCTSEQCANKWKSLKRTYMDTVDHNSKSGNSRKDCKFYEELNELYGNKESTKPSFLLDSSTDSSPVNQNEEDGSDSTTEIPQKPKRKVRQLKSSAISFLEEYVAKQEQEAQKRHDEKMQRFDRLLDILEKKTCLKTIICIKGLC